jgi:hypothetical protein
MSVTIRPRTAADRQVLLGFIRELQEAERAMHDSRLPGDEVAALCYGGLLDRRAEILIAEGQSRLIGCCSRCGLSTGCPFGPDRAS